MISRVVCLWVAFVLVGVSAPEVVVRDGVRYFVWRAEPAKVRVVWKDDGGGLLRTLPAAGDFLEGKGEKVLMLMNGGIFEPGGVPSGLLVQGGKEFLPLNLRNGVGNFFLKPNGVFLIGEEGARVVEAGKFSQVVGKVFYAVQSGPLLLENGRVHPAFNEGSKSRLLRNGVGVTKGGEVIFVISDAKGERWPNLWGFADLFRSLGCEDALFLDGDISQVRFGKNLDKGSNRFGSVIGVVE